MPTCADEFAQHLLYCSEEERFREEEQEEQQKNIPKTQNWINIEEFFVWCSRTPFGFLVKASHVA